MSAVVKINLLPWREQRRIDNKKSFFRNCVISFLIVVSIFILWFVLLKHQLSKQDFYNNQLKEKITALGIYDREIELSRFVREQQRSNAMIVRILTETPQVTPPGIFLISIEYNENNIIFVGKAKNDFLVSSFVSAIERSKWFYKAHLKEITTNNKLDLYKNNFTVESKIKIQ